MNDKNLREQLGKLVSLENEDNWWRQELFEAHTRTKIPAGLEIVSPPPPEEQNYNCFVYALGLQSDQRFLGNAGWEFTRKLGSVFDEMIRENILRYTNVPKIGVVILYRSDEGVVSHVGLMENKEIVISKWS